MHNSAHGNTSRRNYTDSKRIGRCDKKIPPPLAKSGIDRLKECTNIFGPHVTTTEEEESTDPPRVDTKKDATSVRVEKENKTSAQTLQRTDKKQNVS